MVKKKGNKKKGPPNKGLARQKAHNSSLSPASKQDGFSLLQEALHTGRNYSAWSSSTKLRHKTIAFVGGGKLVGDISDNEDLREDNDGNEDGQAGKESEAEVENAASSATISNKNAKSEAIQQNTDDTTGLFHPLIDSSVSQTRPSEVSCNSSRDNHSNLSAVLEQTAASESPSTNAVPFFVDVTPSLIHLDKMSPSKIESASPSPSSSSDEVLFLGRNSAKPVQVPTTESTMQAQNRLTVTNRSSAVSETVQATTQLRNSSKLPLQRVEVNSYEIDPTPATSSPSREGQHGIDFKFTATSTFDKDLPVKGSMAMQINSISVKNLKPVSRDAMTGLQYEEHERSLANSDYQSKITLPLLDEGEVDQPTSLALRSLALDDSTCERPAARKVERVLDSDEDYKLFSDGFESPTDLGIASVKATIQDPYESSTASSSSLGYEVYNEDEILEESKMTEEQWLAYRIDMDGPASRAFLLSEQEKRGITSTEQQLFYISSTDEEGHALPEDHPYKNKIVTREQYFARRRKQQKQAEKQREARMINEQFDKFDVTETDSEGDSEEDDFVVRRYTRGRRAKRQPHAGTKKKGQSHNFPSASLMADVLEQDPYNGFDVMDFDRPSLRPRKKGRKFEDAMPFELSDDDLRVTLRSTWENDREKKRLKKAEREELRSQGLLGRKESGKIKMKDKYDEGMNIRHIKDEFQRFFDSDSETLLLPPMGTDDRKLIHELGMAFGLKTKSIGNKQNRAPMLIKTLRTTRFNERMFMNICRESQMHGFFPRLDKQANKSKKGPLSRTEAGAPRMGRSGGVPSGVSYRDGEVVGAGAPELDASNKGRAMLEKLGWKKGMALGAAGSEGILQPIAHTVKTGKAGLG